MRKKHNPQEKKKLSYKKDRRNCYGERGANSRYAIRNRKNKIERQRRHGENQMLRRVITASTEDDLIVIEDTVKSHPKRLNKFYKMPDVPLGEVVSDKQIYRELKGMGFKKKSKADR